MEGELQAEPIRIAVLCGTDDARGMVTDRDQAAMLEGNNDLWRLVDGFDKGAFFWRRMHLAPNYFRQQARWDLGRYHVALNLISDPDQNPRTLAVADKVLAGTRLPVVNRPSAMASTQRHEIAGRLAGLPGLVVPKVLLLRNPTLERVRKRCEETGFRFPAIVRLAGTHTGEIVGLFDRPEDVEGVYGDRRNAYFLIEWVDLRFADGLYRKSRFFVIGDSIIPRQHIVAKGWNIHGRDSLSMLENEAWMEEMRRVILGGFAGLDPRIQAALRAIHERVTLDCFGIDACMTEDNRLVIFEVNATMNFFPKSGFRPEWPQARTLQPASEAMLGLVLAKAGRASQDRQQGGIA
jgi:hypothetical protein